MTQDEPERDKVEEIQNRLLRVAMLGYVPPDDLHVIADAADAISASEKRAEEARANSAATLDQWRGEITKVTSERDSLRSSLARAVEALTPFAELAESYARAHEKRVRHFADEGHAPPPPLPDGHRVSVAIGDLRKARSALHRSQGE